MKTPDDYNFSGKKALVRVDFNVPLNENFTITDDTRIRAALPTINKIIGDGGAVILMSHLGRPKGLIQDKYSLKPIIKHLSALLGREVKFAKDCINSEAKAMAKDLIPGDVLLLENLRFHKQEEAGTESFAEELASLGDIYINDAFGTAHRAHASTTVVAKFFQEKAFGYLLADEVRNIEKVLNNAERPLTAILGGAKVSGKILIIEQLMDKIDNLIIGGGMAYTFIKAQGGKVGSSLVEDDRIETAKGILEIAKQKNVRIHLPLDTIYADSFSNEANTGVCAINQIPAGKMGLDIGPETEKMYAKVIACSKTILWNGPMGVFEMENFAHGTKSLADAIVDATSNGAYSLVGGGDSVAAINKFNLASKVSYVSTGGGAMLEYLEGKTLPGVAALN
ncbi:MAG: phosphoglycerate kinase [Bacteroidetes bacterium]|nr:phosphoglycerate kinase [Bacteroidota bacterium]HET6245542.1 phosphoglycerate kinase [Bacteroidia bacterium]